MDTELNGIGLSMPVCAVLFFKLKNRQTLPIVHFGINHKFLECMTYNGRGYAS
jgi:hypothetical protein